MCHEVDFEKPFGFLIGCLGFVSRYNRCMLQALLTPSMVFLFAMPALLIRTVGSP